MLLLQGIPPCPYIELLGTIFTLVFYTFKRCCAVLSNDQGYILPKESETVLGYWAFESAYMSFHCPWDFFATYYSPLSNGRTRTWSYILMSHRERLPHQISNKLVEKLEIPEQGGVTRRCHWT